MKIKILEFFPDEKGKRIGWVDFFVDHGNDKTETFRAVPYFKGDKGHWISMPVCERAGQWKPKYERNPPMKELFSLAAKELKTYLETNGALCTVTTCN